MKNKDTKNITNERLAELINELRGEIKTISESDNKKQLSDFSTKTYIKNLDERMGGLRVEVSDLRKIVDKLEEGAFSKDEKEDILAVIKLLNQQFKDEVLGNKSITLTRDEYNGIVETVGFENKFEKVEK